MVLIISTIVILFVAEIILRQVYPVHTGTSFQFRIPHKVFGWVLQPRVSYINEMKEATVSVVYNSTGWRDTEHNIDNLSNTLRILILGDSFMEAYSVNLSDALPKQLERLANKKGVDTEVINLGVGGYGTLQEYLVFRDIGRKYKPDVVLLGFYLDNDVRNNSMILESIVNQGSMKVNSRPFVDTSDTSGLKISRVDYEGARRRYLLAKEKKSNLDLLEKLKNQSALVNLLRRSVRNSKSTFNTSNSNENNSSKNDARSLALFGINYCHEHPDYTKAWNVTKLILDRLNSDILRMGSKLVVFTVPALHEVDLKHTEKAINKTPQSMLCLEDPPSYRRLSSILRNLNIEYIDLLPTFRDVTKNNKVNLFRISDRHWNERGHSLAAKTLYSALVRHNLISVAGKDNDAQQGAAPDRFSTTLQSGR